MNHDAPSPIVTYVQADLVIVEDGLAWDIHCRLSDGTHFYLLSDEEPGSFIGLTHYEARKLERKRVAA
jgi:hypothetical protein